MPDDDSKTRIRAQEEILADLDAIAPYPRDGDVSPLRLGRHLAVTALRRHQREMTMEWEGLRPHEIHLMVTEFAAAMALFAVAAQEKPGLELALDVGPWCPERLRDDPASVGTLIRDAWDDGEDVGGWLWSLLGDDAPKIQALTEELAVARKAAPGAEPVTRPALALDLAQWDRIIDVLQWFADGDPGEPGGGREASDLAVLLRCEIDRQVPGTYGGCDREAVTSDGR